MRLADLSGRRVVVWGPGSEGLALAAAISPPPAELHFVTDDLDGLTSDVRRSVEALGGEVGPVGRAAFAAAEVLVRTAGVSRYRPELVDLPIPAITPTALWFNDHAARPIVAVTGTKGKSTTAALINHLLRGLGVATFFGGNIGLPLSDSYAVEGGDGLVLVVEVSSHQTADLTTSPTVGVVTNLSPDHLPWHGGDVEVYYRDKLNLLAHRADAVSVLNGADDALRQRSGGLPNPVWFGRRPGYRVAGPGIVGLEGLVVRLRDVRLPGAFNLENVCAALAAVKGAGHRADPARLGELVASFEPLPGRLDLVATIDGVGFYDDAYASNPKGALAACGAFPGRDLTVILGGADRGVPYRELIDYLAARRPPVRLVAVPDSGEDLAARVQAANPKVEVRSVESMADAVTAAADLTPHGGAALFAPAAPTPPRFGNAAHRSRAFKDAARALTGSQPG